MVDLWVILIIYKAKTHRTIKQCPARIRQYVIEGLKEKGYDQNGDLISSREVENDGV